MKKLLALVLLMTITTMSFAQKNELKAIEKALKKSNFASAKSAVSAAEALLNNMDDKSKAKFYYLKAKALLANGSSSDEDVDEALSSLTELRDFESSIGKLKYTKEAEEITSKLLNDFLTKANNNFTNKNFKPASKGFERVYKMSPKDTIYLYYAAVSAVSSKDTYNDALNYYTQLKNIGYTGVKMNYYATNVETNAEETFNDKVTRDLSVKAKTHKSSRDGMSESKTSEIVKNVALIYISQGNNEKAIEAMTDARKANPDDIGLIISEANIHLEMGNKDKFKSSMKEAIEKDPKDPDLFYNIGVIAAQAGDHEEAKEYYQKAIELNPNYVNAYTNLAVSILNGEAGIVDEMNSLGNSAADNRKYDELKDKRDGIYKEAIPHLEKAFELKESNVSAAKTLMSIYSSLGETEKYKAMKSKVEVIETNSGN